MHDIEDFFDLIPDTIDELSALAIPGLEFGLTDNLDGLDRKTGDSPIKQCRNNVYLLDLQFGEQHIRLLFSMDNKGWTVTSPVKAVDHSGKFFRTRTGSLYYVPKLQTGFPVNDTVAMLCLISALKWHGMLSLFRLPGILVDSIQP